MTLKAALAWAEHETRSRVTSTRPLKGGITSKVHAVNTTSGRFVLRRYLEGDGKAFVEREARTLEALTATDIDAPELVAIDPNADEPALLMTRVPGQIDLAPNDPDDWLEQMAATLVRIHHANVESYPYENWLHAERFHVPTWSGRPSIWRDAMSFVKEREPRPDECFIHHDYQHFNLLWSRGRLTGVIDWVFACNGPPDVDVAHCRRNLAVLYSPERADHFRDIYERLSGRTVDPWWDIATLLDYSEHWPRSIPIQVAGRIPVDTGGMNARIEDTLAAALARV